MLSKEELLKKEKERREEFNEEAKKAYDQSKIYLFNLIEKFLVYQIENNSKAVYESVDKFIEIKYSALSNAMFSFSKFQDHIIYFLSIELEQLGFQVNLIHNDIWSDRKIKISWGEF
jgi:hypothetical protein